jgi:hypothetical protein
MVVVPVMGVVVMMVVPVGMGPVLMAAMTMPGRAVLLGRAPVAGDLEPASGEDAVGMGGEGAGHPGRRVGGGLGEGGADVAGDPRLVLRESIEQGGDEHIAGHAAKGVEMDLHHA